MFDFMQKWLKSDFKYGTVWFLIIEHDAIIHLIYDIRLKKYSLINVKK